MAEIRIIYEQIWIDKSVLYYQFILGIGLPHQKELAFLGALDTYRIKVSKIFLLKDKKRIFNNDIIYGEVAGSELDIDYFKIVNIIPAKRYGVWKTALKMFSDGKSKEEVLDYLKSEAVAEVLSKS